MVNTTPARNIKLYTLREQFGLTRSLDPATFAEWQAPLPSLNDMERTTIDRIQRNYLYLLEHPVLESIVKMVVLSPLLDLAGFYNAPFKVTGELAVQVAAQDGDETIQGNIDVLVLHRTLWVTVIEAKNSELSLTKAIPQCLAYMLASPNATQPTFGAVTNGSEFIFLKLIPNPPPCYALSNTFSLLNQGNDYYQVLQIFKQLGGLFKDSTPKSEDKTE